MTDRRRRTDRSAVVPLDAPYRHREIKKRVAGLTEEERQILLAELAEITAELDELQSRAVEIASRIGAPNSSRLANPA